MSKYGEPLRYVRDIDGPKLFGHASDGDCLFAEICDGDVDTDVLMARVVACVNAIAGVTHPEKLPELLESVRIVMEDVTHGVLGDDTLPQVMAAVKALRRTYAALMGETP